VQHSEYNASAEERLELLQIWINPEQVGLPPRYEQKSFDLMHTENKWQTLASPSQEQGSLKIFQNAWISQVILESDARVDYELHDPKNGVYVFVIEGQIMITNNNGDDASKNTILSKRDAVGITETESLNVIAYKKSHILAIEVPM
jgi:redox-sensitive bicupin YhaK (pirin superfamily)